ncbi:MAG TPA: GH92 family glycosyl hydrolase [Candidatus Krumholzibacteria bacterium]|nr:GH92 family glycosyl hydrolase [Candidatus Krumholzibacteria bacterium]HPD72514.1 GH92 family glycosyl hydrolase [Candidatus Krumholzibacteria bacterium]HRY40554.1 GH92 family glycosyl hydrolase [Candidatus Krumholzibacteria bacterium]
MHGPANGRRRGGRSSLITALGLAAAIAFAEEPAPAPRDLVDPFIGTAEMGHTYPGATAPFGLVQLSPETDIVPYSLGEGYNAAAYRYCSGYQYGDSTIVGFAHTHFNGTGHSDLGDLLIAPTIGDLVLEPGPAAQPDLGYRSRFSHAQESASPGYYRVTLLDHDIEAELTATERVGLHRYTFPATDEAHLILDLTSNIYDYPGKTVWSYVRMENDTLLTGSRQTSGWARTRTLYFAIAFSKPVASFGLRNEEPIVYRGFWRKFDEDRGFPERAGRRVKCHFDFATEAGEQILVKVALSGTSTAGALANLAAEAPGWDFDGARRRTAAAWDRALGAIVVEADPAGLVNFYTALYHCHLGPVVWSDVDGQYRGLDQNVHRAEGYTNHTIFSLWDTYRALHPLLTLLQPARTGDFVQSMLAHRRESVHGILPVWSHHGAENWCMIGYHAVPVIADAWVKGVRGFDPAEALDAMLASATYDRYDGLGAYRRLGWVPADSSRYAASQTLEYAFDDWTIARMAESLGRADVAAEYDRRAGSWRALWDPSSGFLRARNADGSFPAGFDPLDTHGQGYIEGNAWNYSLYVPHDVAGFAELIGGRERLAAWLDTLFVMQVADETFAANEDITRAGMIGNYVHGNEPSHHVPYLDAFIERPWRTQARVREILDTMYRPAPDGLCGNDDCGQMSAWYIFSALGFYPVAPGSDQYVLGSPCVRRAEIALPGGRTFTVVAENQGAANMYVREVSLNGVALERNWITHEEVARGGTLRFVMGAEADRGRATGDAAAPYSMSR